MAEEEAGGWGKPSCSEGRAPNCLAIPEAHCCGRHPHLSIPAEESCTHLGAKGLCSLVFFVVSIMLVVPHALLTRGRNHFGNISTLMSLMFQCVFDNLGTSSKYGLDQGDKEIATGRTAVGLPHRVKGKGKSRLRSLHFCYFICCSKRLMFNLGVE